MCTSEVSGIMFFFWVLGPDRKGQGLGRWRWKALCSTRIYLVRSLGMSGEKKKRVPPKVGGWEKQRIGVKSLERLLVSLEMREMGKRRLHQEF